MTPLAAVLLAVLDEIETDAARFRTYGQAPIADCLVHATRRMRDALESAEDDALTLAEAALESGYGKDHLRHLVASGQIPNAGRRGSPRIARRDLPRKAGKAATPTNAGGYDPDADALQLVASGAGKRRS